MLKYLLAVYIFLFSLVFLPSQAQAKIQYAAKHRINRCTACHLNPIGGSVRNKYGKAYGQYGYLPSPFSKQDLISADVRTLFYQPEKREANRGGMGIMVGQIGLNAPLMNKKDHGYEARLVFAHSLGSFASTRSAYLRWKLNPDTETSWLPQYILAGRFYAPFGIIIDEHRTYVRMQNRSTWKDFETGILLSANPLESLHYDLAVVNGLPKNTGGFGSDQADKWGYIANIRVAPASLPLVIGASYSKHSPPNSPSSVTVNKDDPESWALYAAIPLQRIFSWLPLTLTSEYQESRNWNEGSEFSSRYLSDANYKAAVIGKTSKGFLFQADLFLTQRWNFIYKYDSLLLNKDFSGDTFTRQGFGLRRAIGPNMLLHLRYESASGGSDVEPDSTGLGKQDAFWILLQVGV